VAGFIAKCILYLCRLISGVQVEMKDAGVLDGTLIFYANHSSHLDAMVILSLLPEALRKKTFLVGSREYWQANALRRYISNHVFKTVMIARAGEGNESGAFSAISDMSRVLHEGNSLIIFPEGTRSFSQTVSEFKRGIYHLAKRNNDVRFIPIYLENMNRIMPKGELLIIPLLGRAIFGNPIRLIEGEDKEAFLTRARNELVVLGEHNHGS
jgi:1-acyl-sn-glycerol-3-phosphate acyltransferase